MNDKLPPMPKSDIIIVFDAARALADIVLDQCSGFLSGPGFDAAQKARALRAAIAEAEEVEPVATCRTWHKAGEQHAELWEWTDALAALPDGEHNLYTRPPAERQPLTDEQIDEITHDRWGSQLLGVMVAAHREYARAVERAHGIGGSNE